MTQYATWASYGGDARTWLALGLLAAAGAAVLAGIRLPLPVRFIQPGARRPGRHNSGLGHLDSGAPGLRNHLLPAGHSRHPGVRAERARA